MRKIISILFIHLLVLQINVSAYDDNIYPYFLKNINVKATSNDNTKEINVDFEKNMEHIGDEYMIVGIYELPTYSFVGVIISKINDEMKETQRLFANITFPDSSKVYYLKCFVWNMPNIEPLSNIVGNKSIEAVTPPSGGSGGILPPVNM